VTGVQTCALPISPKPQNPKTPIINRAALVKFKMGDFQERLQQAIDEKDLNKAEQVIMDLILQGYKIADVEITERAEEEPEEPEPAEEEEA